MYNMVTTEGTTKTSAVADFSSPYCDERFRTGGQLAQPTPLVYSDPATVNSPIEELPQHCESHSCQRMSEQTPQLQDMQIERLNEQAATKDNLMDLCLAGRINMQDIVELVKRMKMCNIERSHLEHRIKELLKTKNFTKQIKENERKIQRERTLHLFELQSYRSRCGELEKLYRFDLTIWDDDLNCSFTLHREFQNLLQTRSKQKRKTDAIVSRHRQSMKENERLKESLENAVHSLTYYRAIVDLMDRKQQDEEKHEEYRPSMEEMKTQVTELETTTRRILERLISEQMQREIDQIKTSTLLEGLKKRAAMLVEDKRVCQTTIESLKKNIEESLRTINEMKLQNLELQKNLDTRTAELEAANKNIAQLKKEVKQLTEQLAKLTEKVEKYSDEIQQLDKTLLLKEQEIQELDTKIFDLLTKLARVEKTESVMRNLINEKDAENRRLVDEIDASESANEVLTVKVSELTEKLEEAENKRKRIKFDLGNAIAVERLEKENYKERIEVLLDEFEDLKRSSYASHVEYTKRNERLRFQLNEKGECMYKLAERLRLPYLSKYRATRVERFPQHISLQLNRKMVRIEHRPLRKPLSRYTGKRIHITTPSSPTPPKNDTRPSLQVPHMVKPPPQPTKATESGPPLPKLSLDQPPPRPGSPGGSLSQKKSQSMQVPHMVKPPPQVTKAAESSPPLPKLALEQPPPRPGSPRGSPRQDKSQSMQIPHTVKPPPQVTKATESSPPLPKLALDQTKFLEESKESLRHQPPPRPGSPRGSPRQDKSQSMQIPHMVKPPPQKGIAQPLPQKGIAQPPLKGIAQPAPQKGIAPPPLVKTVGSSPLTLAQSMLLKGAESASGELLKRKPLAGELAAVATSGAQQLRSPSRSLEKLDSLSE